MRESKALGVWLSICTGLLIFTLSVAAPILWRGFYYGQIDALEIQDYTGLSRKQIITAYDEMMDYCLGKTQSFSTGVLPWSESGRSHFQDVRGLFLLDLRVLGASLVALGLTLLIAQALRRRPGRIWGRGFGFWAALGLIGVLAVVTVLAASDFDRAFTVFHQLFFPGKDNWVFDWRTDAVILILPQEFFRNCAILIGGVLAALCGALITGDMYMKRRAKK